MIQCPFDRRKCQFGPWDLVPQKQSYLEALRTWRINGQLDFRAIHQMHLADVRHSINGEQSIDDNFRAGFFARLALRAIFRRLALFHETRGQCPEVFSWFDRAATQQDVVAMRDDGTHHDFRIGIMDMPARAAHIAFARVAVGNAPDKMRTYA